MGIVFQEESGLHREESGRHRIEALDTHSQVPASCVPWNWQHPHFQLFQFWPRFSCAIMRSACAFLSFGCDPCVSFGLDQWHCTEVCLCFCELWLWSVALHWGLPVSALVLISGITRVCLSELWPASFTLCWGLLVSDVSRALHWGQFNCSCLSFDPHQSHYTEVLLCLPELWL